ANAALAGAGPEHLPVIVAAVRAVADPRFNLAAVQTTTHPCTPLVIVNGPVARRLEIHGGAGALGSGFRPNAVIGRAVRLVLQNVGGAGPGTVDRATLGHPGKFAYCLAENEAASPWEPLHVERGFAPEDSTVTVVAAEAPHNVNDHGSTSAEALLAALAGTAATPGNNNVYLGGEPLVLLSPEHAATVAASGWSKRDLKRAFWERARVPLEAFSPENLARFAAIDPARFGDPAPGFRAALAGSPDDILVVVAGGPGKHSAIVPTFGATRAVTVAVVW
ncbi:MAG TPA: UGSC family (seleno)protein, partial [Calidithermus sp.]|nr:UGSC family (seleno)protein [Calidithermus sp.]